ncbi:unnamed protein product [Brachionus calyciflorus]|uniref:Uncharacterized protein n=1 Tax=Brachionus calyciflorus TaxID=104777 RepID=A0A814FLL2_9BILA|nr:unnamed protein product [Brachionus calyciflorus]
MEKIFRSNKTLLNHPPCPENWVIIDSKGRVIFKEKFKIINCSYSTILWTDDHGYSLDYFTNITNGSYLDTNKEFFHIKCFSEREKFYHVFSRIFKKEEKNPTSDKINVLVFLMDSLSREDWFENVPKSMEYLVKKIGAKVFKRYNTIGDATAEALTALFTSKKVNELPSMFSEDMAFIGTFQMRFTGMRKAPVDHYARPYQISAFAKQKYDCLGGQTHARANFEYGESFADAYKNKGFFGAFFLANYSHQMTETLQYVEKDLLQFLEFFNNDETLKKNTMLLVMSDHGPRFIHSRKTLTGLLKERNPLLSIYMPELFRQRYPNEYINFLDNTNKLLTPMDVHRTWLDLISLQKNGNLSTKNDNRSISLFSKIPLNRKCAEAGIDPHFCSCLKRTELRINGDTKKIALEFVKFINEILLKDIKEKCAKLELEKINQVFSLEANLLKHQKIVNNQAKKYFFQIETRNNNGGLYEFTVTEEIPLNSTTKRLIFDKRYISRINKYGRSADCIKKEYPGLREFCFFGPETGQTRQRHQYQRHKNSNFGNSSDRPVRRCRRCGGPYPHTNVNPCSRQEIELHIDPNVKPVQQKLTPIPFHMRESVDRTPENDRTRFN